MLSFLGSVKCHRGEATVFKSRSTQCDKQQQQQQQQQQPPPDRPWLCWVTSLVGSHYTRRRSLIVPRSSGGCGLLYWCSAPVQKGPTARPPVSLLPLAASLENRSSEGLHTRRGASSGPRRYARQARSRSDERLSRKIGGRRDIRRLHL